MPDFTRVWNARGMRGESEGRSEERDDGRVPRGRSVVYWIVQYLLLVVIASVVAYWLALNA